MNRTKIEWVKNPDGSQGYTFNPVTGCLNHTPEGLCKGGNFPCYAYKLAHGRVKPLYLANRNIASLAMTDKGYPGNAHMEALRDPFYPRFWEERLLELPNDVVAGKERGIFVCDMGDLFGIDVPKSWTRQVIERIQGWPEYRLYLLTKQAQRLPEFSPFPENCWVGVTATNGKMAWYAMKHLKDIRARVKFLSFEPLLATIPNDEAWALLDSMGNCDISWLIIGACTGSFWGMVELCKRYPKLTLMSYGKKWTAQPPIEWLQEIVAAADKAGVKVFLKDNLEPLIYGQPFGYDDTWAVGGNYMLRQEFPNGKGKSTD